MRKFIISLFTILLSVALFITPAYALERQTFGERYSGVDPTGLVLWLDQSDARSYGDTQTWYDLSGNGNHIEQATAGSQPTISGALNLAGSCRIGDGGDDYMHQKILDDETGATAFYFVTTDGSAAVRVAGVDLMAYIGKFVVFTDSAGKKLYGYIKAVDTEEALGGENVQNPGFETAGAGDPDFFANWNEAADDGAIADEGVIVHGGSHAAKLTAGAVNKTTALAQNNVSVTAEKLFKFVMYSRGDGTYQGRYRLYDEDNAAWMITPQDTGITGTDYDVKNHYFTAPVGCSNVRMYVYCPSTSGGIAYFDDISVKEVTHLGTDAVLISSTPGGATQNWTGMDPGFNPNDAAITFEVVEPYFNITGNLTVSAWAKTPDVNTTLVSKWSGLDDQRAFCMTLDAAGYIYIAVSTDGTVAAVKHIEGAVDLSDDAWHMIAVTFTPSTEMRAFADGVSVGVNTTAIPATIYDTFSPFQIGCIKGIAGANSLFWNGEIASVMIFNRVLSAAEIQRIYNEDRKRFGK